MSNANICEYYTFLWTWETLKGHNIAEQAVLALWAQYFECEQFGNKMACNT